MAKAKAKKLEVAAKKRSKRYVDVDENRGNEGVSGMRGSPMSQVDNDANGGNDDTHVIRERVELEKEVAEMKGQSDIDQSRIYS